MSIYPADWSDTATAMNAAMDAAHNRHEETGSMYQPMGAAVPLSETAADDLAEPFEPADQGEPPYQTGDTY